VRQWPQNQTGVVLKATLKSMAHTLWSSIRPENAKKDRKDRRLKRHQTGKRRVIAMRSVRAARCRKFCRSVRGRRRCAGKRFQVSTMSGRGLHWDDLHGYHVDCVNHFEIWPATTANNEHG
jgi:hypothetical protein